MAGSAAAAVVGARRGSMIGRQIIQQRRQDEMSRRAIEKKIADEKRKMEVQIMEVYDRDGSGKLSKKELKSMLFDYGEQKEGLEVKPTKEDIDFIIALCGSKNDDGNSQVDKTYVLKVCIVWGEFLKQRSRIKDLIAEFDANEDLTIDKTELQPLLDSLNEKPVPPEVTNWVMEQSDITRNDWLGEMELVRAVCAFEKWRGNDEADPAIVVDDVKVDENLPSPNKCCCVIS